MKYEAYKKANKVALAFLVSGQLLVITGFLYVLDWLRKPNFIGYLLVAVGIFQLFRLVREYRKPGLGQGS